MEMLQLRYFCDAAETENFTKTANKYRVPTSNISQTIRRLEQELGVSLFTRTANKIALNDRGRMLHERVKTALDLLDSAREELSDADGELHGKIHILIESNRQNVTRVIERFKSEYPLVDFVIHHSRYDGGTGYDFIVSSRSLEQSLYQGERLLREKMLLACHKDSELLKLDRITVKDLAHQQFITMHPSSNQADDVTRICASAGFLPNVTIQSDDPQSLRQYLDMGLGVSLIPSVSWKNLLMENTVLCDVGEYYRETYLYRKRSPFFSKAKGIFSQMLVRHFEEIRQREGDGAPARKPS